MTPGTTSLSTFTLFSVGVFSDETSGDPSEIT